MDIPSIVRKLKLLGCKIEYSNEFALVYKDPFYKGNAVIIDGKDGKLVDLKASEVDDIRYNEYFIVTSNTPNTPGLTVYTNLGKVEVPGTITKVYTRPNIFIAGQFGFINKEYNVLLVETDATRYYLVNNRCNFVEIQLDDKKYTSFYLNYYSVFKDSIAVIGIDSYNKNVVLMKLDQNLSKIESL